MADSDKEAKKNADVEAEQNTAEVDPNEAMAAEWAAMAEPEEKSAGEDSDPNDDMAAEWAALVEEDAPAADDGGDGEMLFGSSGVLGGASSQPTRILNQDEIDSLLGFDLDDDDKGQSGIQLILDSGMVSYERLPMLEVVFDRLVRTMTTSLRNFTSENVEVLLDTLTSVRFGDYLNSIPLPAMLSVFKAEEWDNYGLLTVDSALIYSVVDVLLGGRHFAGWETFCLADARRGAALHHYRTQPRRTNGPCRPGRSRSRVRTLDARQFRIRPIGDQPALRRHRTTGQRGNSGENAYRHGRPRRQARNAVAIRHPGTHPRASIADVHGREIWPRFHLGDASRARTLEYKGGD